MDVNKLWSPNTADEGLAPVFESYAKLPTLSFSFKVDEQEYLISTDDPLLYGTRFSHPSEIDKVVLALDKLRQIVHIAYLQASKHAALRKRESELLMSNLRKKAVKLLQKEGQKDTMQAIESRTISEFYSLIHDDDAEVLDAVNVSDKLKELHWFLKNRQEHLLEINKRFIASPNDYGF